MNPSVAIIILNWNNATDTLACLESVFQMDYPNFSVLVVDNGSTDDSVAQFQSVYPDLDLLLTGDNLGYAGGNNAGISKALASSAEYICILNNDTVVEPAFLSALVQEMDADSRTGVVGPMTYFYDPPSTIFSAGCDIDWRRGIVHHRGMGILADDKVPSDLAEAQDVDAIAGCGFLVSRAAIDRAGYFDPTYFLNFEDIDWCVRIARCGFRVRYVPAARLYHKVSATQGQDSPATTYYMTRNALWFFGRHSLRRLLALTSILYRTARTVGAWTLKPRYHDEKFRQHRRATMQAVSDFFRRKTGPAALPPNKAL